MRDAVETQACQVLSLILRATPAPDDDREVGKPGPQPFTEIARLGEAPGWHQPNTDDLWRGLLHQGEHFGRKQGGLGALDRKPPGIKHVLEHLERHCVGLVMGRTRQDADWRGERRGGVLLGGDGHRNDGCGGLGGAQVVDQLARGLVNEVRLLGRQVVTPLILFRIVERGEQHGIVHVGQRLGLQEFFHDLHGAVLVPRHEPLVVAVQLYHRLIAQQYIQEGQLGDVFAEHAQAHGERGRQEEADRPPEPGPERKGHQ